MNGRQWDHLVWEARIRIARQVIATQEEHDHDPDDHFHIKQAAANIAAQQAFIRSALAKQSLLARLLKSQGLEPPDYDEYQLAQRAYRRGAADAAVPPAQPADVQQPAAPVVADQPDQPVLGDPGVPGVAAGAAQGRRVPGRQPKGAAKRKGKP